MENLFYNISQVLGITIIHSIWQGLLIYVMLRFLLQCLPNLSSARKYDLASVALVSVAVWFIYTLLYQVSSYNWQPIKASTQAPSAAFPFNAAALTGDDRYYFALARYLPGITIVYFFGLIFNSLKFALAWQKIRRVKQTLIPTGLQELVDRYAQKFQITKYVKVNFSELIDIPCIVGYFKPIVLLPVSLTTSLSAEEIEAIILHELAHIRRNDYLFNVVQQIMAILLFFNPFSYFINRIINHERENCCDDMVVQATSQPLVYAKALLKIEESRQQNWQLALAATGKKYHLLNRIERIMKTKRPIANLRPIIIIILLFTVSLSSIAWLNPKIENGKLSVKVMVPQTVSNLFSDTVRKQSAKTAKKTPMKSGEKKTTASTGVYGENSVYWSDDEHLNKLAAEVQKHADAMQKLYESPEFTRLQEQIEKKGEEMQRFYDQPQLKKLQEEQEQMSKAFNKWNDNPEFKEMEKKMSELGEQISKYYESADFKNRSEKFEKEGEWFEKHSNLGPDNAEYKLHQQNFKKAAEEFKKYNDAPGMKEKQEQIKILQQKFKNSYWENPEYKKQLEAVKLFGDSIRKAYDNPAMKQQQQEMKQYSQAMRDYQNNPEIQKEKRALNDAEEKLRQYQNSPAYKQRIKALEKTGVYERREAPERTERAEIRESAERREAPEIRERVEATEKREAIERVEPKIREGIRTEVQEAREKAEVRERRYATERKERKSDATPADTTKHSPDLNN